MDNFQNLNKFSLPESFRGASKWKVQLWWIVQSILFSTSPQFMYSWRRFLLRCFGAKIGKNVIIRPSAKFQYPWKISIGDNSWIGDEVTLYSLGVISIGKNVVVSQRSYLCTGSHDYLSIQFDIFSKEIVIEDECWIATDVFIAPGVTLGKGCVIGARSSVFQSQPFNSVCIGTPAKVIKSRI